MKNITALMCVCFITIGCEKPQDPFAVEKQNIGLLTDSTQVMDLKAIFADDSIVKFIGGDEFTGNINSIDIYEKGGKKLLELSPSQAFDSTAIIESVRVMDPRFRTQKNISLISTFKDVSNAYTISSIDNLINSVVVSVNEINAAFTIDKKELPANARFDMDLKIEETQIPDSAKIKYFMIHWN